MNKVENAAQKNSRAERGLWWAMLHHRSALVGLIILAVFVIGSCFAPWFTPYDPTEQLLAGAQLPPFSPGHWLGTDELGRDLFSRILYGGRLSLLIGFFSVAISFVVGGVLGLITGYYGRWVDVIIMRFIDILLAFPYVLLTIVIVALLGPSLLNAMVAIGLAQMPNYARILRSSVLVIKE